MARLTSRSATPLVNTSGMLVSLEPLQCCLELPFAI
uniref:Uncharacterized protein n=1 Tax=Arundo donax TaxID=35708 RepID=A0A0A9C6Y9_ARUDO